MDYKEYARQLRENCAKDADGVIRCSPELWEQIAAIIESSEEVKHGYWKDRYGNKYDNHLYECSVCGEKALYKFYKNELMQEESRQALTPICPPLRCKNGRRTEGGCVMPYVKLEDVLDIIKKFNWNLAGLMQHIKEHCSTADVEEVVRCEDCQWATERTKDNELFQYQCRNTMACGKPRRDIDFCSYGERKEEK